MDQPPLWPTDPKRDKQSLDKQAEKMTNSGIENIYFEKTGQKA